MFLIKRGISLMISRGWSTAASGLLFILSLLVFHTAGAAPTMEIFALFTGKAMIIIDGKRQLLKKGDISPEGVEILQATTSFVLVKVDGEELMLKPGVVTTPVLEKGEQSDSSLQKVVLWADDSGFFHADGHINGKPVRFLVDTGANTIAINSQLAQKLGLDLSKAQQGIAKTAGGDATIFGLKLDTVSIGPITVNNVIAGVVQGINPQVPLLGASFLNHVEMLRKGNRMELSRRR
ncbi:MAG: aspartyl protease family protein [Parasphingorhabdus sp.]